VFTSSDWADLAAQFIRIAREGDAQVGEVSEYGQKYLISGTLVGKEVESGEVITVWIVLKGNDNPRLVTVYPR
jgi:hypothetical protein